jgi:hypothetical protein
MNDKERRIVEARTNEALKKKLIGWNGKIGVVLRNLGQPIFEQSSGIGSDGGRSASVLEDYYDSYEEEVPSIDTMEVLDEMGEPISTPVGDAWSGDAQRIFYNTTTIGYYYQLMQNGLNLEMRFLNETKEMIVNYQGNLVFKEIQGELYCYVPSKIWEQAVDSLFEKASKKEMQTKEEDKNVKLKKAEKQKDNWINDMKKFWGI